MLLEKSTPSEDAKHTPIESHKRSSDRPTSRLTKKFSSRVMERPKAFYITERLDKNIDAAVRQLQDVHGIKRVDRSVVVTAILDNENLWTEKSLDGLVDRVISELTSRSTG